MDFSRRSVRTFGISNDESRRKREKQTFTLRKQERNERFSKRRQMTLTSDEQKPFPKTNNEVIAAIEENRVKVMSNDMSAIKSACVALRKLLSDENSPPIDQVIHANIVPRLIECLECDDRETVYEALWCLTNIASGTHDHTTYLVELGCIPNFVSHLHSSEQKIKEQACWVIGNIAGDCIQFRDLIIENDGVKAVLQLFQGDDLKASLVRVAIWALSNLCRGKQLPEFDAIKEVIPLTCHLIYSMDKEVLVDALWTLSFVSDGDDERPRAVVENNVAHRLVSLLGSNELHYLVPTLRIVGNLLSGENEPTQAVIDAGALPALKRLLNHEKSAIRKETCWGISNVLAGTTNQIQQVIDEDIIKLVLNILETDRYEVKKEAAWCIANAVSGATYPQVVYFVNSDCIPALCHLLTINDSSLISMTLAALERTLKVGNKIKTARGWSDNPYIDSVYRCDGVSMLEKLINHDNTSISKRVDRILDYFHQEERDEDGEMDMADSRETYEFNVSSTEQPTTYSF